MLNELVCIISTQRSGSTLLVKTLDLIEAVMCFGEVFQNNNIEY